jgi:hypothetical protein
LIPLTLVVLLLPACSDSADDVAATEETTAITEAPATTAPHGGDESRTEGLSAEVEAEINALIEEWFEAWREGDGQAAVKLFTADGRYVSAFNDTTLEGVSGEELKAKVERLGGWQEYGRTGMPLISWRDNSEVGRPNAYYAVETLWPFPEMPEKFELYNIVDENGTLKFRYVEGWAALGWSRLSEDSPYRIVGDPDY